MRAMASYAASRCGAAAERPVSSNTIRWRGSMNTSTVSSGSKTRTPGVEHDPSASAKSRWTKLSEPVISVMVDLGGHRHGRGVRPGREKDGGAESRSCSWHRQCRRGRPAPGGSPHHQAGSSAPVLRSTMVLSGGSAKVRAVTRSFGLRKTSIGRPELRDAALATASRCCRRAAAPRAARSSRRRRSCRSRRRCAAARRAVPRAACSRDWRAARRAARGRHS